MKLNTALASLALVSMMAVPFAASAQTSDHDRHRNEARARQERARTQQATRRNQQVRTDLARREQQVRKLEQARRADLTHQQSSAWRNAHTRIPDEARRQDWHWKNERYRQNQAAQNHWNNDQNRWRYDNNGRRIVSNSYYQHRQDTKNEWRNIAIGAGALSLLGLFTHDNFLTFTGAAGALYSLNRYEQDRRSQNNYDRARAAYFGHSYFYRNGVRYDRRTVTRNGERFYQFYRG